MNIDLQEANSRLIQFMDENYWDKLIFHYENYRCEPRILEEVTYQQHTGNIHAFANFLSQNSTGNCSQNSTQSTNYNQAAGTFVSQQQTYAQSAYQQQFQQSSYQQAVYLAAVGAGSVMGRGAKKQKRIFESFRKGPNKNKMMFFSCVCLVFHYSWIRTSFKQNQLKIMKQYGHVLKSHQ